MLEANKAIVRRFTKHIDDGNLDEAFELLTSEYAWHGPSGEMDRDAFKGFTSAIISGFPDFIQIIEDQIAEGDRVVSRVTIRGTHKGEFQRIAPTHKAVTISEITIDRISAGRIAERWVIFDALGLMQQLGVYGGGL